MGLVLGDHWICLEAFDPLNQEFVEVMIQLLVKTDLGLKIGKLLHYSVLSHYDENVNFLLNVGTSLGHLEVHLKYSVIMLHISIL